MLRWATRPIVGMPAPSPSAGSASNAAPERMRAPRGNHVPSHPGLSWARDESGVSAVLGTAITIGIVLVLAATFMVFAQQQVPGTGPAVPDSTARSSYADRYVLSPDGPDGIPIAGSYLLVVADGVLYRFPLSDLAPQLPAGADKWMPGQDVCVVGEGCLLPYAREVEVSVTSGGSTVFHLESLIREDQGLLGSISPPTTSAPPPPPPPPAADPLVPDVTLLGTGCVAGLASFADATTSDDAATIRATWDFGDASPVQVLDPMAPAVQHQYILNGTRVVTVVHEDSLGRSATTQLTLVVCLPSIPWTITNQNAIQFPSGATATITVLGGRLACCGGLPVPITMKTTTNGGASYSNLFGGLPVVPGTAADVVIPPGGVFGLEGTGTLLTFSSTYTSIGAPGHVHVLDDGQHAPSANDFDTVGELIPGLVGYIDVATQDAVLAPNQALTLWQFTSNAGGSGSDFQELVVLLTFH